MAYSVTYAELQAAARQAVGLKAVNLSGEDAARIAGAPNEGVEEVAQARRWPRLVKDLELTLAAGASNAVLPEDFSCFERDSVLAYTAGVSYPDLVIVGLDEIRSLRARLVMTGPPQLAASGCVAANGDTYDGRLTLEFWPAADAAYTLVGSYRRQARPMSAADDLPDVPLELHRAVRVATELAAREAFNQEVPEAWEARLERLIQRAWKILGPPVMSCAPLRSLRGFSDVPVGKNRNLAADYPKLG